MYTKGSPGDWVQYTEGNADNPNEFEWGAAPKTVLLGGTGDVLITRVTDMCSPVATYYSGSAVTAKDLNDNQLQALFLSQEAFAKIQETFDAIPTVYVESLETTSPITDTGTDSSPVIGINDASTTQRGSCQLAQGDGTTTITGGDATDVITRDQFNNYIALSPKVQGGSGINVTPSGNQVTVSTDLATNGGLKYDSDKLTVKDGSGISLNADGVNVQPGAGISVSSEDGVEVKLNPTDPGLNVTADGLQTFGNQTGIGTVQFGTGDVYTFPSSDGAVNNVLATDGSGNLSWQNFSVDNPLEYAGTVDLTGTPPSDPPLSAAGNFYANTGTGTMSSAWATAVSVSPAPSVVPGNIAVWNGTAWSFVATVAGAQDLQQVTDVGSTTNNEIQVAAVQVASGQPSLLIKVTDLLIVVKILDSIKVVLRFFSLEMVNNMLNLSSLTTVSLETALIQIYVSSLLLMPIILILG